MKKFIKHLSIYFLLTSLFFYILNKIFKEERNYNSAFVDKLKILQANKNIKKIVLIGGSSVGWGLSAEQIEIKTGIKTINLGHNAGFGLSDFMNFISQNLTKEDIIVFSPEWNFYSDPNFYDTAIHRNLIMNNYEYGRLLNNYLYMLMALNPIHKVRFELIKENMLDNPYRYNCFNNNGDIISHCNLSPQNLRRYVIKSEDLRVNYFKLIFPFLASNKTIFLFPPTQRQSYEESSRYLKNVEFTLIQSGYLVLDKVEENIYPDSSFFDAEYHLTCSTRISRTNKLIKYLSQFIK